MYLQTTEYLEKNVCLHKFATKIVFAFILKAFAFKGTTILIKKQVRTIKTI